MPSIFLAMFVFQSTPSVGRATTTIRHINARLKISIHALRGEGDYCIIYLLHKNGISIHALRGEGDVISSKRIRLFSIISIHALRGEGDVKSC